MASPKSDSAARRQPNKALAQEMADYGIRWVPVDYYHFGAYRYTNLQDAIAEAKRANQTDPVE